MFRDRVDPTGHAWGLSQRRRRLLFAVDEIPGVGLYFALTMRVPKRRRRLLGRVYAREDVSLAVEKMLSPTLLVQARTRQ